MAITTETSKPTFHFRSISLPSNSHPLAYTVQEQLNRLKSSEAASSSSARLACQNLGMLKNLYNRIEDWLQLPGVQQELCDECNTLYVEGLADGSLKLFDVCGNIHYFYSQMRDNIQEVQSSQCRQRGFEASMISRKKLSKAVTKYLENLRRMQKNKTSRKENNRESDISMLQEAEEISQEIFQSLLCLLSGKQARTRRSAWSSVSKLLPNR